MLVGLVLLGAAAFRLTREDRDLREPGRLARAAEPPGPPCTARPCQANADPRPARGYEVPSVAVDGEDPDHIVVTDANLIGGQCGWHVTFDGGRTWEDGVFQLPPGFRSCQLDSGGFVPAGNVTMGPSGTVYAVLSSATASEDGRPSQGESVLLAVSTDGGRTFPQLTVAVPGGTPEAAYLRPSITAAPGPSGRDRLLLSFWGCRPGLCNLAVFARSDDGGATFSPPTVTSAPPGGNSPSRAVVDADGTVYVLFLRRFGEGQDTELLVARSTDGGQTFSATVMERAPDIGLNYDSTKLVVDPGTGTLYTVFADQRDGEAKVFFRRSSDKGVTWSRPRRLNQSGLRRSYNPEISVGPGGRVDVVFYQRRTEDMEDVQWAYSTDGGQSFSRDRQLNDRAINRRIGYRYEVGAYYPPSVSSSRDGAVVAWSDSRNGTSATDTQDTFLLRLGAARPPGRPGPATGGR